MQKTTPKRLVLVPEELYQSLLSAPPSDGTALGHVRAQMDTLGMEHRRRGGKMPADGVVRYEQEWKRYSKLAREEADRPLNVQLKNVKELVDAAAGITSAATAAAASPQKQVSNEPLPEESMPTQKKSKRSMISRVLGSKIARSRAKAPLPTRKSQKQHEGIVVVKSENNPLDRAMQFILENGAALGVTTRGQLLKKVGGKEKLKTANMMNILDHLRHNEGARQKPLPVGYSKFVHRMEKFPELRDMLFERKDTAVAAASAPSTSTQSAAAAAAKQSGTGVFSGMHHAKTYKKPETSSLVTNIPFVFKPALWN